MSLLNTVLPVFWQRLPTSDIPLLWVLELSQRNDCNSRPTHQSTFNYYSSHISAPSSSYIAAVMYRTENATSNSSAIVTCVWLPYDCSSTAAYVGSRLPDDDYCLVESFHRKNELGTKSVLPKADLGECFVPRYAVCIRAGFRCIIPHLKQSLRNVVNKMCL
jgi:hypothetical protein